MSEFDEFEGACLMADAGLGEEPDIVGRDLEVIETEILFYKQQAGVSILEIGRRLIEAKDQLEHGEWTRWLKEKVDFSERSAQNFMRLAREYKNPQTLADLGASKALALLALPVSEREEFADQKHAVGGEEKSVSEMSTRELEEAIRQRDEAKKAAAQAAADQQAAEDARDKLSEEMALAKRRLAAADENVENLQAKVRELESRPVDVAVQVDEKAVERARNEAIKVTAAQAQECHERVMAEAKKKAASELKAAQEDLKKARADLKAEEEKRNAALKELEALRAAQAKAEKQSAVRSDPALVEFNVYFQAAQEAVGKMRAVMKRVADGGDQETAGKLQRAFAALGTLVEG